MKKEQKGFTACGNFYVMGFSENYLEYLKKLFKQIKQNSRKL